MTKSEAGDALDKILAEEKVGQDQNHEEFNLEQFVENIYCPFYKRKWKRSTAANNVSRVDTHLVSTFPGRTIPSFSRDELQDLLDGKAEKLSFSMVAHLR